MCRKDREAGQAFPIYIAAVAGLLFLAFAFFAVGQAAASRNDTQTAADAAALAAGQSYRDQLRTDIRGVLGQGGSLTNLLQGFTQGTGQACADAQWYAARNGADASCGPEFGPTRFSVHVTARRAVGHSIIPATSTSHASADATAVVRPRCTLGPAHGDGTPGNTGGAPVDDGGKGSGKKASVVLVCDGHTWSLDPDSLDIFPDASDLFSVQLAR